MKKLTLISAALFLFSGSASAQILPAFGDSRTGTTGLQFLKIAPDARASAMSGAYIAVANDVSSLYWNPAGIAKVDTQKLHLQASHSFYYADVQIAYVGAVHPLSSSTFLGVSLYTLNTSDMAVTTAFYPFGNGQEFSLMDMAFGLTFAKILTDNFNFGLTGKYVRESVAGLSTNNLLFDFGFQYDIGIANTRFAVGLSNFGFNTSPNGTLPIDLLSGSDTITGFEKIAPPAVFRLGFAWDAMKKDDQMLTLAGQLNHPTDNNETFSIGAEYNWKKTFFARTGYEFGRDESGIPSFGGGYRLMRNFGILQIDYGFSPASRLGAVHRITLGFSFL